MFLFLNRQQMADFRRETKVALLQAFIFGPALMLASAWAIRWAANISRLPGNDLAQSFLLDSFTLLAAIQTCVVLFMAIPVVLCALNNPAEARRTTRASSAIVFGLVQQVAQPLEWLERHTTAQPVLTTRLGNRSAIRPQRSLLTQRFSHGTSPQLE